MNIRPLHRWSLSPRRARELQQGLRRRVSLAGDLKAVRSVAGCDLSLERGGNNAYATVIVYSFPELIEIERSNARARLSFPYVPGLLSFREGPVLLKAFRKLKRRPDLVLFDGQGYAHPRRFGLASHLGLWLDLPSVGCAKSRLCGEYSEPGQTRGESTPLTANGEIIGSVLRTRDGVKPVFVSVGHRLSLESAVCLVLACGDGYRLPKPTREADIYVGRLRRGER